MNKPMQRFAPGDLRFPASRAAATRQADALLRADNARRRRMRANDDLGGAKPVPASRMSKSTTDGPFAVLKNHPAYRAPRRISSFVKMEKSK